MTGLPSKGMKEEMLRLDIPPKISVVWNLFCEPPFGFVEDKVESNKARTKIQPSTRKYALVEGSIGNRIKSRGLYLGS
jgi:hypothetical protein